MCCWPRHIVPAFTCSLHVSSWDVLSNLTLGHVLKLFPPLENPDFSWACFSLSLSFPCLPPYLLLSLSSPSFFLLPPSLFISLSSLTFSFPNLPLSSLLASLPLYFSLSLSQSLSYLSVSLSHFFLRFPKTQILLHCLSPPEAPFWEKGEVS